MSLWNERYSAEEYVFGTEPNDFLVEAARNIPPGRVLCLGEGEGRNAVHLAGLGHDVLAVDAAMVGLAKANKLARSRGVTLRTRFADLGRFPIEPGSWDLIVSIFCHMPSEVRAGLHQRVAAGLKPGGLFILEAYTPRQLEFGTGGPPVAELMMTLAALREELAGLQFLHAVELDRDVLEGSLHTGRGAVVQVVARKPGPVHD
ncbi:MAG TPA: class I SAM-dependent methyltransferase [Thiobacillaceae bacterium]|nr:class I SAM-dependent methyltransferase [Thiobacillaceae bacterium]HNH88427.1 class I SAM-dependent methyltransferase [Thiobacillaceae bacterium]